MRCDRSLNLTVTVEKNKPNPIVRSNVGINTSGKKNSAVVNGILKKNKPRNKITKFISMVIKFERTIESGIIILGKYTFFTKF
ncbi:hypothetical protein GCM10010911_52360 [Paenibacillus nasutitermitis]|uniref:Uncharacterized protein n=1 Tax=Paenibacillus nasutitermitis TaxID=1652958 RepID=A0A916ZCX7_9BACL|nr:hypothetical protein GCM10010911_52360 [Paenibacillus nasutitermitis]